MSAYIDKFVVRKEHNFIQPVIDWEAGLIGRLAATLQNVPNLLTNQNANHTIKSAVSKNFEMHFEKFVKFIISELETNTKSYGSLHWWPFTKLCGLCSIPYDFIGKVETLKSDIQQLDSTRKFQNNLTNFFGQKFNHNDEKKEETSRLYFKQLSKDLVVKLHNLYFDDFVIGNYEYPEEFINLAKD